jgi:predicted AlkP superfamily pyrophosphatase or phosphodiesterase
MGDGTVVKKTAVLIVVGLTPELLGDNTPVLRNWAAKRKVSTIMPPLPAVTCSSQATFFTGQMPSGHGIVGNGWYFREDCEVHLWRQSNKLVQAPSLWDAARQKDPGFTCANLFGWFNMYSSVDYSITPRPMYPADGRKIPDVYTFPGDLRDAAQAKLGTFPLFEFWGPRTSINSTKWIAESAKFVDERYRPTMTIVYLPHLDYGLQKWGPDDPAIAKDLKAVDDVCGDLIRFYEMRDTQVIVLSEYGIVPVKKPIHINRVLRKLGFIAVRNEMGLEVFDAGASAAFAVADHQAAHVYVNDLSKISAVRSALESIDGVDLVLDAAGKQRYGIDHNRAGELLAVAQPDAWFTYYYWLDDKLAPDFARTVDIHRKPGYDPVELFIDPALRLPMLKVGYKLMRRKAGFRDLLDVIPLDATLVRGSHGRIDNAPERGPLFIGNASRDKLAATEVYSEILSHLGLLAEASQ